MRTKACRVTRIRRPGRAARTRSPNSADSAQVKMHVLDARNSVQAALVAAAGSLKALHPLSRAELTHRHSTLSRFPLFASSLGPQLHPRPEARHPSY